MIRDAFRRLGYDAWSCDLRECEADPAYHFRGNVFDIIGGGWRMAILHPECTYLTNAAEWAYPDPDYARFPGVGYHQRPKPGTLTGAARRRAREEAILEFNRLLDAPIPMMAVENPKGIIGTRIRKADQTIQPHQFGEDAAKRTLLWLRGLPKLNPTGNRAGRIVKADPQDLFGHGIERWSNQTDGGENKVPDSARQWIERSRTYPGVAAAMATQWGAWLDRMVDRAPVNACNSHRIGMSCGTGVPQT